MGEVISGIVINIISSLIYDGSTQGVQHAFLNKYSRAKLEKRISKKVNTELGQLLEQNRVFDGAAFTNYIQNMQPIQKIHRKVSAPERSSGILDQQLITQLTYDTVTYLRGENVMVSPEAENIVQDFYRKVMKICDEECSSLLTDSERGLARLLGRNSEKLSHDTVQTMITINNDTIAAVERTGKELSSQFQNYVGAINGGSAQNVSVSLRNAGITDVLPYKYRGGSDKESFVRQVLSNLRQRNWIHLYGKVFSGKTQALIRIAERVGSYAWISVDEESFLSIELSALTLPEQTVIILDGIPRASNTKVKQKCLEILSQVQKKKCKLITSGYENIEPYIKGYLEQDSFLTIELLGLSHDDIDEIMRRHNAPEELLTTKAYQNFAELCGTLPPIVMEVIHKMEHNGWQIDTDVFLTIISRRTDTLAEQMVTLFLENVPEENTRRLYYRILYLGNKIRRSWIPALADIPVAIAEPDTAIESLKNRWIFSEGQFYQCPNMVMEQFAQEHLRTEERKALDHFAVQEILKNQPLDLMGFSDLIKHYSRLEEYDAEGMLCVSLMKQMRENDVKKCFLTVENFWEELPLPKGMSPVVKCNVRLNQLYFRAWKGGYEDDLDQRAAEIWGFVDEEPMCALMIAIQSMAEASTSPTVSLALFDGFMKHLDEVEKSYQRLEAMELESVDNIAMERIEHAFEMVGGSLFVAYNEVLMLSIKTVNQLEEYADCAECHFTMEQWQQLEKTPDMDALLAYMLKSAMENSQETLEQYETIVKNLYDRLDAVATPKLWTSTVHVMLYALHENGKYSKAVELYDSVKNIVEGDPVQYCEVLDSMARVAHDNGDAAAERELFQREIGAINRTEEREIKFIMMDTCLLYLDQLDTEDKEEIEKVYQSMQHVAGGLQGQEEFPRATEKAEAEYWMKMYQMGELGNYMDSFLAFIRDLLEEQRESEDDALIAILTKITHVMGYIGMELLKDKAPQKFADGSDYMHPDLRMFWNNVSDADVVAYWRPDKRQLLYHICAELAEKCDYREMATELFRDAIEDDGFWSESTRNLYCVDSYIQLKFLELGETEKLFDAIRQNYLPRELPEIEIQMEFYLVVRELMVFSMYLLSLYQRDEKEALAFCETFIRGMRIDEFDEVAQNYYQEYIRILKLIIQEGPDFDLLKEVFYKVQKNEKLGNLDTAVLPLLLMDAPRKQRESLRTNVRKGIAGLKMEDDFALQRVMEGIS